MRTIHYFSFTTLLISFSSFGQYIIDPQLKLPVEKAIESNYELKNKQNYLLVTICTECQTVQIIDSPQFTQVIEQSLVHQDFSPKHHCLELLGQCALCFSKRNKPFIKISEKANG